MGQQIFSGAAELVRDLFGKKYGQPEATSYFQRKEAAPVHALAIRDCGQKDWLQVDTKEQRWWRARRSGRGRFAGEGGPRVGQGRHDPTFAGIARGTRDNLFR